MRSIPLSLSAIKKFLFLIALTFCFLGIEGQNREIDSLTLLVEKDNSDSLKIKHLSRIFDLHLNNYDTEGALKTAQRSLEVAERSKDKILIGLANLMMGIAYKELEEYPKSQIHLMAALKNLDREKTKKQLGDANSYMGFIQEKAGEFKRAISYHKTALMIRSEIGEKATSNTLGRLGTCYSNLKQYDTAFYYFNRALGVAIKYSLRKNMGGLYNNLGINYDYVNKKDSAIACYKRALAMHEEFGDMVSTAGTLINIGSIYHDKKDYNRSIEYTKKGFEVAKKINHKQWMANAAINLSGDYYYLKDWKLTYDYYKLSRMYFDTIFNETKFKEMANVEGKYQGEKKQQELEIAGLKLKVQGDQLNKNKTQRMYLILGLCVCAVFLLLVYLGYNQKRRLTNQLSIKNEEIVAQKSIIEEKNKDITDSIYYAKQIQLALLASEKVFAESFTDHFILYKPKDIVSGDFYWAHKDENEILIANADCTGHGVPGAFMSLIGVSKLNEIVREKKIKDTNKIMDLLREGILDIFNSDASGGSKSKDGMDMVLLRYNFKTKKVQFSGANNSIWLYRGGKMIRCERDKFPVGFAYGELQSFTAHEFLLEPGDIIFTFSDGYADQFGGPNGKKFKYKNIELLLLKCEGKPMKEIKKVLETTLVEWQGKHEQVDDITVIGLKI